MRFQVPQFIEVEDKIFGPLSWRQFVFVIGGVGLAYVIYVSLPFIIAILLIGVVLGLAGALAFFQFNGRPFIHTLEAAFNFSRKNKLYLWKKSEPKKKEPEQIEKSAALYNPINVPRLSESRLKDISWSLEVNEEETANT